MSARGMREQLRDYLAPLVSEGVNVYHAPPEAIQGPAIVIGPGRPYLTPGSYGQDTIRLRLTITTPRAGGTAGLDQLDDLVAEAQDLIRKQPGAPWTWLEVIALGPTIQAGGVEHTTALADIHADLA